jgi:hypothetical protein
VLIGIGLANREALTVADRESILQVKCRLRRDLVEKLAQAAEDADRSVSAEIAERLEASFREPDLAKSVVRHTVKLIFKELDKQKALKEPISLSDIDKLDRTAAAYADSKSKGRGGK